MLAKKGILAVLASAAIITALFYHQSLGLNLLFFETLLFSWLLFTKQFQFKGLNNITLGLGLILTLVFTIITHSIFSYIIHFIVVIIFIGLLIYPEAKSLLGSFAISFLNIFSAQGRFLKELTGIKLQDKKVGSSIWKLRIFIIPILVIILFIVIYRKSNPVFNDIIVDIGQYIQAKFTFIFKDFDFLILLVFLIGLVISNLIFMRTSNQTLVELDAHSSVNLQRKRKKSNRKSPFNAFKNEYRAGVFLFLVLNIVILALNIIDIKWVWFGFEWEGQYMKQFVHEGTYLLILSILISIGLVLYYFRGKLNFYQNHKLLKYLSYIWLAQNGILVISVAIRNFLYIDHFSLAYKRIGVIIFLLLTIYGLYTVFIKVRKRKSGFYLFKTNTYALVVILIISSIINWDSIIARYNFNHSDHSFLHLDWMSKLSDKALPYLDVPLPELKEIDLVQKEIFPFEKEYMSSYEFHDVIEHRKTEFREEWESKGILSWNLAEYMAYRELFYSN